MSALPPRAFPRFPVTEFASKIFTSYSLDGLRKCDTDLEVARRSTSRPRPNLAGMFGAHFFSRLSTARNPISCCALHHVSAFSRDWRKPCSRGTQKHWPAHAERRPCDAFACRVNSQWRRASISRNAITNLTFSHILFLNPFLPIASHARPSPRAHQGLISV